MLNTEVTNYPIVADWYVDNKGKKVSVQKTNEIYTVVNDKIMLMEIPDEFYRVTINGFTEIKEGQIIEAENQFKVNYRNGMLTFDHSQEGKQITITQYYSKGLLRLSAEHVFTKLNDEGQVIETLQDIISSGLEGIPANNNYATKTDISAINLKLQQDYVSKDTVDLQNYATKNEVNQLNSSFQNSYATKDEVNVVSTELDKKLDKTTDVLIENLLIKSPNGTIFKVIIADDGTISSGLYNQGSTTYAVVGTAIVGSSVVQ